MNRFFLLITLAACFSCQKLTDLELLMDYGARLQDLEAFEYWIDHTTKYTYTDKVSHRKGWAYFEKNDADTLLGYKYYFNSEAGSRRYVTFLFV